MKSPEFNPIEFKREILPSRIMKRDSSGRFAESEIPLEFRADPLTGLITAAALVRPDKKLGSVEARSVGKRFKEKSFAAGASRENIATCSELGIELDEFIEIGLKAMQGIATELEL
jgi:predicted hydrolase (HD superfamily)